MVKPTLPHDNPTGVCHQNWRGVWPMWQNNRHAQEHRHRAVPVTCTTRSTHELTLLVTQQVQAYNGARPSCIAPLV